jgi:hypothetical protein
MKVLGSRLHENPQPLPSAPRTFYSLLSTLESLFSTLFSLNYLETKSANIRLIRSIRVLSLKENPT